MKDESPVDAIHRILGREFGVVPTAVQTMMLIDAVRDALPPQTAATIASLRAILRSLEPNNGLELWAVRSSREIVDLLAKGERGAEGYWCQIEGTIAGMLLRVTRGLDVEDKP